MKFLLSLLLTFILLQTQNKSLTQGELQDIISPALPLKMQLIEKSSYTSANRKITLAFQNKNNPMERYEIIYIPSQTIFNQGELLSDSTMVFKYDNRAVLYYRVEGISSGISIKLLRGKGLLNINNLNFGDPKSKEELLNIISQMELAELE